MAKSNQPRDVPLGGVLVASNRLARRNFDVVDTLEVGLVLSGSEVKSIRESKVQLVGSWARISDGELWLHNMHVSPYSHASPAFRHEPDRPRKLLAHRKEIIRLEHRRQSERLALIPLALYFVKGRAKLTLALARGKSRSDRRRDLIKREADLEAARSMAAGLRRNRNSSAT